LRILVEKILDLDCLAKVQYADILDISRYTYC